MVLAATVDYTSKDYASIRVDIDTQLGITLPKYTDRSPSAFGNVLIGSFSYVMDVVCHYMDKNAGEAFFFYLQERRSALVKSKGIAYVPRTAKAALVTVVITVDNGPAADDVQIPQFTEVRTPDGISFETQSAVSIVPPATAEPVSAEHSVFETESFTGDGLKDQEYLLPKSPFLDESEKITVDAVGYTKVDSFLYSDSLDKHYTIFVDEDDRARFRFGNGTNGVIPANGSAIVADYKTGGGLGGNVAANTVTVIEGTFKDDSNNAVTLSVDNAAAAGPLGEDRQTTASIKEEAPLSLRQVGDRTVSKDDYVAHGELVPGVERILALGQADDPALLANEVDLVVVPTDLLVPSATLKAAVKTMVTETKPNTIGINVLTSDPTYVTVNFTTIDAYHDGVTKTQAEVATDIQNALIALFAPRNANGTINKNVGFGSTISEIPFSLFFKTVANVAGVQKLDEDTFVPADDIVLTARQWPKIGTVTVTWQN